MADTVRLAIISDTHGNRPAFEAVLAEVDRRGPFDTLIGGGDYAFGGAFPDETLARVVERGLECVRGNTDEWIVEAATGGRQPARGYEPEQAHNDLLRAVDVWAAARLNDAHREFLAGLSLSWEATGPSGQKLAFVHATPWSTHPIVLPDAPEEMARRMLDEAGADMLLYGHIHHAYVRPVGDRTLACVGSVGMPFDGDWRPCFAIAEDDGSGWRVEHVRVEYDREAYLTALLESGEPNAAGFVDMIRERGGPA
ncbi:MAG TPA: metallophosphoesterase family protein [Thermomicrobiales bacterium]|nr:metallophosphoesterase family protein [Thermomicrobiales bacterium]